MIFSGYEVVESGDRLEDIASERFLFMPNHQSTADVPLCMTIFAGRFVLEKLAFFLRGL